MINSQKKQRWVIPILISLIGGFMSILDSSIVTVAIAPMMSVFATTSDHIQWVVTVYMLTLGVVIPFAGGLLMPTMMTLVKKIVPEDSFGTAMGIVGVGMAFAAVSAQAAALDSVSKLEVGDASAISNIVSRVSASFGIAVLTSILTSRTVFHAKDITARLLLSGSDISAQTNQIKAMALVNGLDDIFLVASVLTI